MNKETAPRVIRPATLDDKRRLVMPTDCPAHAPVMLEQVAGGTWLVRLLTSKVRSVILLPLEHPPGEPSA